MCETSDVADARACVRAAVERHDAALRRAFSALLADIWRNRRDPSAAELALRDEQSAWVEARERNCLAATPEIAGEPWQVRRFNCFALRSAERVGQLRARVHWTRRPNGSRSR